METRRNKKNNLPKPIVLAPLSKQVSTKKRAVDYKNVQMLNGMLTEGGKILPRRSSGMDLKSQKQLKIAIKRARILALIPFVRQYEER